MTPKLSDFQNKDGIQIKEEIVDGNLFYIVSYIYNDSELWRDEVNFEARGLTFDSTGKIVSRPFEKFFNINENQFTQFKDLDFTDAEYFEKLDGSMITGLIIDGVQNGERLHFKTKKSFYSDVALECNKDFAEDGRYVNFITGAQGNNKTPIFEYTSPMNRVILDYGMEPKLTLLAIRDNESGEYATYFTLDLMSKFYDIPLAKKYDHSSIVDVMGQDEDGREGYVIYLKSGQRVKAKFPSYLSKHRVLDNFNMRTIANMIVDECSDDMKPLLTPERLKLLEKIEKNVLYDLGCVGERIKYLISLWVEDGLSIPEIGKQYSNEKFFHPAIQIFKGKDFDETVKKFYKKQYVETFSTKPLWY